MTASIKCGTLSQSSAKTCLECSDSFFESHNIVIVLDTKVEVNILRFKSLTVFVLLDCFCDCYRSLQRREGRTYDV